MGRRQKRRKKQQSISDTLQKAYFDPAHPGSFGGKTRLLRSVNIKRRQLSQANKWLSQTDSYTLHRPWRKRFQRRKTLVAGVDYCWQMDLTILNSELSKANNNIKCILFCIDVFSKYAWAKPLANKAGETITTAVREIMDESKRSPYSIQTDKGKEFLNTTFQTFLESIGVNHYTSENNDIKASVVERLQRTIKERLYRYFTHTNNYRFLDVLSKFMFSYNNSYHTTIKMKPSDVDSKNQETIWNDVFVPSNPFNHVAISVQLQPGDQVRISKLRGVFEKGYLGNWSDEIYEIASIVKSSPLTYILKDSMGEQLAGSWYESELQKVTINNQNIYKIETVLGTRKLGNRTQYLVKWFGYPAKFNSYIDESDLTDYKN